MQKFDVTGMSCSMCSARVEKAVSDLPGVDFCSVNLMSNLLTVEGSVSSDDIISAVTNAGYGAKIHEDNLFTIEKKKKKAKKENFTMVKYLLFSVFLFVLMILFGRIGHTFGLIAQAVLSLGIMIVNRRFFISGVRAVFHKSPNMDTLVSLGSFVSYIYSLVIMIMGLLRGKSELMLYFDSAAMILVFVSVGKLLETRAKMKTSDALDFLADMAPKMATVIADGKEVIIDAAKIMVGDIFIVRPGEKFPADGTVLEGFSTADESAFTGESIPCDKEVGSHCLTGSLNISGFLKCRVEKTGEDTALASIIKAAQDAASGKAPIARIADKVSAILVPSVLGISLLTFLVWLMVGKSFSFSIARAISVLVITCPCSLGLATPVSITIAQGISAKRGILFKNAAILEGLSSAKTVCFDKTGTLTMGSPKVTDIISPFEESYALSLVYALEYKSEHPLAKAICQRAESVGTALLPSENLQILPGSGISGLVQNRQILGGSLKYMNGKISAKNIALCETMAESGKTPLIFTIDGDFLCIIALRDTIRPESAAALSELNNMGLKTIMITGDNAKTAGSVASSLKITDFYADILPENKAKIVSGLGNSNNVVMVGDGINDAPALIAAGTGMAIGTGTDIAIDSADMVLMSNDISNVPFAIKISRKTMKNIKENLFWAFFYNMLCIPLAAGAFYPLFGLMLSPMWCAMCMSLSSLCVVGNAMRLMRMGKKIAASQKK